MPSGFCVTRVLATTLRIAWANYPRNIRVAMAAMIFVYAGVILLFIANLFFAQRIVRAQHPHFGWSKPFSIGLPILLFIIIGTILCLIAAVILEFYSLSDSIHTAVRDIQIYGSTLYSVVAFLPIPIVGISTLARQHPKIKHTQTIDKFGEGSMTAKIVICLFSAVLLTLGAAYRAGTTWLPPVENMVQGRPVEGPWYFSRGSFYAFNFSIEIFMVWFWLAVRIDKRFIIPNGAKGPYSYGSGFVFAGERGNEKPQLGVRDSTRHLTGSQTTGFNSARGSRVSWATGPGSRRSSLGAASRASWGGISRENVAAGFGEDGAEVPYLSDEEAGGHGGDFTIDGVDQEMGWDPKSGKWALRPVSGPPPMSPAMMRPLSTADAV